MDFPGREKEGGGALKFPKTSEKNHQWRKGKVRTSRPLKAAKNINEYLFFSFLGSAFKSSLVGNRFELSVWTSMNPTQVVPSL